MDIILSNSSDKPIYEQIASQVKAQILSGALAAGAKLPSIRALASDLGVSVIHHQARLRRPGATRLICTVQGKGCFVAEGNQELLRENQLCHIEELLAKAASQAEALGVTRDKLHEMLDLVRPEPCSSHLQERLYHAKVARTQRCIAPRERPLFTARRHACRGARPDRWLCGRKCAGKTTTIRAALGLIKPDAGEVHLLGQRCDANAPDETQRHLRSRIGLVLDTCPFPSTLKVGQVEKLVGPAYPTWSCETFAGFIDRFGLDHKTKVKDLSRGMGMKLQLACALSHNAKLLVLDEATAGLDPMAREELLDELLAFVADGQHSVLLSSHITSDLDRTADRVICIDNGSIVFDLPREDITDRAGIAHCTQAQAAELMACVEGARAAHNAYSVDVLVPNRREALEAFPEIPCDRATIDDYLRLILKGASK